MRSLSLLMTACALLWWWGQQGSYLESFYAESFYRRWAPLHQSLSSLFPFSLLELFCFSSPLLLLSLRKLPGWGKRLRAILWLLGSIYIIFQLSWGLNYGRHRLGKRLGWDQSQPLTK